MTIWDNRLIRRRAALLVTLFACAGCRDEVLHDLNELQANRVLVVLTEAGIPAVKERSGSGWIVSVDSAQTADALRALDRRRVNRKELRRFNEQSKGILQSREERSKYLERQTAWNLEQTLESVPDVLEAHAHLFTPPADDWGSGSAKAQMSASVLLIAKSQAALNIPELTGLIASAVGISHERVVVLVSYEREGAAPLSTAGQVEPTAAGAHAGAWVVAGVSMLCLAALLFSARRPGPLRKCKPSKALAEPRTTETPTVPLFGAAQEVF